MAHIARSSAIAGDEAAQRLLQVMMREPNAMTSGHLPTHLLFLTSTNKPEWRRMQQPAANGHGNARSLAGFYKGLLDGSLLESDMLEQLTREHSIGPDKPFIDSDPFCPSRMLINRSCPMQPSALARVRLGTLARVVRWGLPTLNMMLRSVLVSIRWGRMYLWTLVRRSWSEYTVVCKTLAVSRFLLYEMQV